MSLFLPNDCHIGKISVSPRGWDSPGASTTKDWFIHYRFHDPRFSDRYPKGYLVKLAGMNTHKKLSDRRRVARALIENEIALLKRGYSPIERKIIEAEEMAISPSAPFTSALEKAHELLEPGPYKKEIRKALVHISLAIRQLRFDLIQISEVRRRHIKAVLSRVAKNRTEANGKPWGAPSYNKYRIYLDILFNELDEVEATDVDPVAKVKKKREIRRMRKVLTSSEIETINDQVKVNYYTFWRFIHIFFHSGARMTELMQVRCQDVDLHNQRFLVTIRKGRGQIQEVYKTITRAAMPLWAEITAEAGKDAFLFSRGLKPGPAPISEHQITKRWRLHIKKKLGIEADFYSLKHKNTTEIVSRVVQQLDQGARAAAEQNSHKGTAMVVGIYDVERESRQHDRLKDSTTGLQ